MPVQMKRRASLVGGAMLSAAPKSIAMPQTFQTRGEWRDPPANRWSFRNVNAILPTEIIENIPGETSPLVPANKRWGPSLIYRSMINYTSTDALVVFADGQLKFEYYANENEPETQHILMSSSKAVTGLLLGVLAEKGVVDYQAGVSFYIPEVAGTRYAGATIRDLIDMRAGVIFDEVEQREYDLATNWEAASATPPTANLRSFFTSLSGPPAPHGGVFRYVSANTDLLGWAIERATGKKIATLLSEHLWRPMGAESPAYITLDQEGLPRCAGGFCSTARDFARLGQLVLSKGRSGNATWSPKPS